MPPITHLLTGATVLPINATPIANGAVALRDGVIVAVGSANELADLAGPHTRITRLAPEQVLLPGFNDSHQHLLSYVRSQTRISLWDTTRLPDLIERLAQAASVRPPGTWIVAVGHDQGRLDVARHPTLTELDAIAPHHPLVVVRACSHVALANSMALAKAGLDATTPDPVGGRLERSNGQLTGVLQEAAMQLVMRHVQEPAIDWPTGLQRAALAYHQRGITAIGEAALGHIDGHNDLTRLRAAVDAGLGLRIAIMAYGALAEQLLTTSEHLGNPTTAVQQLIGTSPWLTCQCIKLFLDGTLGAGTAFLSQDYGDEPGNRGWPAVSTEVFTQQVERAHRAGFQVAAHAIGDAAVAMVVDAYERALYHWPRTNHRHRIEHVEVLHPGLAERMARLGIGAGVQSCFTYWEAGDVTRLGPGLAPWGHAWRSLRDAGVVVADGSDNPVLPDFAPLQGIAAAVTRRTHTGLSLNPTQAISVSQALTGYTTSAAFLAFQEQRIGRLSPGMLADLTVLAANPLTSDPAALDQIEVVMTMVDGQIVYQT